MVNTDINNNHIPMKGPGCRCSLLQAVILTMLTTSLLRAKSSVETSSPTNESGGKELISANGLNMYDFEARLHYPAVPQFDRIDPMCEKFQWLSPYLYCGNNPVNIIDPTGMELKFTGGTDDDYKYICNLLSTITNNQYVFNYEVDDETKKATINYSPNETFTSKLDEIQQETNNIVTEIIDHSTSTEISIQNNSNIIIGSITERAIDLEDIKNIGTRNAVTSESAFLHETYEQFWLQSKNRQPEGQNSWNAHSAASMVDSNYLKMSVSPHRYFIFGEDGKIIGMRFEYNKKVGLGFYPKHMELGISNNSIIPLKK